ncbi:phosphate/phosphite/phosphonate ABC transporter substrate-binding protein [Bacillus sp. Au-Bac7]|uniref:phosphate/phosphite/phosphonate ABC transporter substrate-binding protein n=1 Tax=Bacillus sp. Au-Bac7 TaxID=2906458 RepID=UPI001E428CE3|nr:phosphate/phosphite/phosphonate ABC transporter substrate-binding protein [Bacillus sp. Au-Bac7]MCE4049885.1 phosphate/phosphite/phosphonate ABC transporter substrate-binding protein [Bacillus sp. Au-Bac7]
MMKKLLSFLVFMLIISGILAGCGTSSSSGSAKKDKFVIAYLPQESDEQMQKTYSNFEKELSEKIGVKVEAYQANSYNAAIEAMKNNKADMAMFGPFSYIVAEERADAELIANLNNPELEGQAPSVIVVPKDSDIQTIADLEGKTIGFADPVSTTGHLLPKSTIVKELGIGVEDLEKSFFKSVQFAGGHDKALIGVVRGQYDAAGVSAMMPAMLEEKGIIEKGSYRVIAESEAIPVGAPFAVRSGLDQEMKDNIKEFLLSYDDPQYFKNILGTENAKFMEASDSDYDQLRDIAEMLNLSPEQLLES